MFPSHFKKAVLQNDNLFVNGCDDCLEKCVRPVEKKHVSAVQTNITQRKTACIQQTEWEALETTVPVYHLKLLENNPDDKLLHILLSFVSPWWIRLCFPCHKSKRTFTLRAASKCLTHHLTPQISLQAFTAKKHSCCNHTWHLNVRKLRTLCVLRRNSQPGPGPAARDAVMINCQNTSGRYNLRSIRHPLALVPQFGKGKTAFSTPNHPPKLPPEGLVRSIYFKGIGTLAVGLFL